MELSDTKVDDLLRTAEQRLSQNSLPQDVLLPDQSHDAPEARQLALSERSKRPATGGLEPRVVSTKSIQKVSNITLARASHKSAFVG